MGITVSDALVSVATRLSEETNRNRHIGGLTLPYSVPRFPLGQVERRRRVIHSHQPRKIVGVQVTFVSHVDVRGLRARTNSADNTWRRTA